MAGTVSRGSRAWTVRSNLNLRTRSVGRSGISDLISPVRSRTDSSDLKGVRGRPEHAGDLVPAAAPSSANTFPAIYVVRARTRHTATKGRSRRSCWRGWGPRRASLLLLELTGDGIGGGLLRLRTYSTIWCNRIARKVSGTCA